MPELNAETIYNKLDAIDSKVDKLLIWKAEHVQSHELIERDVADSRAALFENPGVVSKVNTLWNSEKHSTKWHVFWMEVLKFLVIALAVGVVTWLLILYKGT